MNDRLTAVLGPTNTGKTHFALERMLAHESGVIGFPLRLLARENYERAIAAKGVSRVALLTGEEKIVPKGASYFFCTVESMPLDRQFAFVAVDEIQLMVDPERGHIFTDRLLNLRGFRETMVLGSLSALVMIRTLVPDAEIIERPRFSVLTHIGYKKVTRLPPRSAVVAFSIPEVYAIAELLRLQRGGAALVLGALSPRARNAQVALYQSGEVDHLVATDAIGMGLNLDIHHIAFAHLGKYDGKIYRPLTKAEMSQIAGRAGRHLRDGTFGTTAEAGIIDPTVAKAIEEHKIEPLGHAVWRNADLDFQSGKHLLRSLEQRPFLAQLIRQKNAEDHLSLQEMMRDPWVRHRAQGRAATGLLWNICQIPDFTKLLNDSHVALLRRLFQLLLSGYLPADWVEQQMQSLDRPEGDIDLLMQRLTQIRTWAFIVHRGAWLADVARFQGKARQIEDRLSDALHQALSERFIDRRKAMLVRQLRADQLSGHVDPDGHVLLEGHRTGQLRAWQFRPAETSLATDRRQLILAAQRMLRPNIKQSVAAFLVAPPEDIHLEETLQIRWGEAVIAKLAAGASPVKPDIKLLDADLLDSRESELVRRKLQLWIKSYLAQLLAPLFRLQLASLQPEARGLAYRLTEQMGAIDSRAAKPQLDMMNKAAKAAMKDLGLRFGDVTLWLQGLDHPRTRAIMGALCRLFHGEAGVDSAALMQYWLACGKRLIGGRAFSFVRMEYMARQFFSSIRRKKAVLGKDLAKRLRISENLILPLAAQLGLRRWKKGGRLMFGLSEPIKEKPQILQQDSPFSVLIGISNQKK